VGTQPRVIDSLAEVIEAWLRADIALKAAVIHERLLAEQRFADHYQKGQGVPGRRPSADRRRAGRDGQESVDRAAPLTGLHRRFEVVADAQAQVDWGDEGDY
jgi:hypothetical protein